MRKWIGIGVVSAATLVVGGIWTHAQVQVPNGPRSSPTEPRRPDAVINGAEVGFRVDGWEGDIPVGRWVVRSEGKWVEPKTMGGIRRLTSR